MARLCAEPTRRAVILAALCACACARQPAASGEGRGVLLVAIDALRADHLGSAGYDRKTTPFLDALAEGGVSFSQAFSTAPWALPAHASLLTGCDPSVSRRYLPRGVTATLATQWRIPDEAPHLAREFLRHGFATGAFVGDPSLSPLAGFSTGFQTFVSAGLEEGSAEDRGVAGVGPLFEQWLRQLPRDRDWFAYLHLSDLERAWELADPLWATYFAPRAELAAVPPVSMADKVFFAVPRRHWSGGLHTLGEAEAHYDGALRKLDSDLSRLLNRIRRLERLERTTIVVVGTHGMSFGESGLLLDHGRLCDVDLRVPLILRPAAGLGVQGGMRTDALASLIDVAPTLLALHGLRTPPLAQGISHAPRLRGGSAQAGEPGREHAFACAGYHEGWVAMDARWCLEVTRPWEASSELLVTSWYGTADPPEKVPHEVLHDRQVPGGEGHARSAPATGDVAERLRAAHESWSAGVESLRRGLQRSDWAPAVEPQRGGH